MKKLFVFLSIMFGLLLFGSKPTLADIQYTFEGGVYQSSTSYYYNEVNLIVSDENVKPFFYISSVKDEYVSQSAYLGFLVIDGDSYTLVTSNFSSYILSLTNVRYKSSLADGEFSKVNSSVYSGESSFNVYTSSTVTGGNIPLFFISPTLDDVVDALINGNSENLVNPDSVEKPLPNFIESEAVYDDSLGYITKVKCLRFNDENLDETLSGYKYTWAYDVTSSAIGPPTLDGSTADGYITKLQIKADVSYSKSMAFEERSTKENIEWFSSFKEMPAAYICSHSLTFGEMSKIFFEKFQLEVYAFAINTSYFRVVQYRPDEGIYYYGKWFSVNTEEPDSSNFSTGYFDEDGNFIKDGEIDYTGNIIDGTIGKDAPEDWLDDDDKLAIYEEQKQIDTSEGFGVIGGYLGSMLMIPQFIGQLFAFLPDWFPATMCGGMLATILFRIFRG